MNKYITLFMGLLIPTVLSPCPTCVGRLEHNSPSFFSDELYKTAEQGEWLDESDVMLELNNDNEERKDG